jgi:hypothetical protein
MKAKNLGILISLVLVVSASLAQTSVPSIPISVDCSAGQSLNRALSKLDKHTPFTISVNGTCTEYIQISGFENLVLKGLPGATLLQPTTGAGNLFNGVLLIESSRSITVQGFSVQADTTTVPGIAIGHGSSDVRLRSLNVLGGTEGILVFENSQVSLAHVTGRDPGYTPLGIYDSSDVHVEHCLFENSTGALWHVGVDVGASHLTIYDTTIKNMQVGINGGASSIIDVGAFDTYTPFGGPTNVTIQSPAGTNFDGVSLSAGASLNVYGAKLVINNPGQTWGGTTGGVYISDGSTLSAFNSDLIITGSHGQGIVVVNNSHATLVGATVTGGGHGGLVVSNLSSIDVNGGNTNTTQTLVGGNSVDLFCDSGSMITGSAHLAGIPTAQCTNLLPAEATLP